MAFHDGKCKRDFPAWQVKIYGRVGRIGVVTRS
jgi:hypothetical protein